MKYMNVLKINNSKVNLIRNLLYKFCLVIGLVSAMIFSFYHHTSILMQFYIGYIFLKLSIIFFSATTACASVFDRINAQ